MVRKIVLVPHDPNWPKLFEEEKKRLAEVFGEEILCIYHIGSTAILGIRAKPVIDILIEVDDIEKINQFNPDMMALGYQPRGEYGIPGRRYFSKGNDEKCTRHVHVFQTGSPEIRKYLDFRDYLMEHPDEARAYEQLKLDLAGRYPHDSDGYTQGKDAFIRGILHRAELWREGKSALEEREIYGKTES